MRIARIQSGTVINTEVWDAVPVRDGFTFVELPEGSPVCAGWLYVNDEFVEPDPAPPTVPASVTQAQFRLAVLTLHGADTARLATAIDAVVLALPVQDQEFARLRWNYTERATRTDSVLISVCGELGLSSAQIDAVFILANTL